RLPGPQVYPALASGAGLLSSIQPTLAPAFMIMAPRESPKPSSTPAWRLVVPLVCSTQPCRSSVASGEILDHLDAVLATSIGGLSPAISLSACSPQLRPVPWTEES